MLKSGKLASTEAHLYFHQETLVLLWGLPRLFLLLPKDILVHPGGPWMPCKCSQEREERNPSVALPAKTQKTICSFPFSFLKVNKNAQRECAFTPRTVAEQR